jgi:hypothetical protein
MVNSNSLPDRPSLRGALGLGNSVLGWSVLADTLFRP